MTNKSLKYFFLILSILFIVNYTFFAHPSLGIGTSPGSINLDIFHDMPLNFSETALINTGGNILLFVPWGISVALLSKKKSRFLKVVFSGFLCSVMIELIQLFLPNRWTDINDVILNTSGSIIGYVLYVSVSYLYYKVSKNSKVNE